jgi:pimeloyl-ACP methyl ester carboxylesterase
MRHGCRTLLMSCALALALDAPAVPAARIWGSLTFEPCTLAAAELPVTVAAHCTTLAVPEDRSQPRGRLVRLAIAWVPSTARRPASDPVFMLAGGPGQAARDAYPSVSPAFRDILRKRDVILVDQRGTGAGNPLDCGRQTDPDAFDTEMVAPDALRRYAGDCRARVTADPRFFTTSDAVLDLEAVRQALGVPRVDLVGVSYGTRLGLEYLRRHRERVRAVVLDGIVPPQLALGAEHARNLEDALDRQLASCDSDPACRPRYGAARETLTKLLAGLRAAPRRVQYRDPLSGELREGTLTAERVAGVVRLYAYAPQLASMLPMSIARAAAGEPEILMSQARMIDSLVGEQVAVGLQLSVTCAEDAPLLGPDPADADSVLGNDLVAGIKTACEVWPRGRMPADFHAPVESDVPALLLSGELDPVTPPRYGELVLRGLPNGRHVVARGQGHNVMSAGCIPRLMAGFLETADARSLDTSCVERLIETPPFTGGYGWEP